MMHVDQLATLLVADNPRAAADKLVAWLVRFCRAAAGGVFSISAPDGEGPQDPMIVAPRKLTLARMSDVQFLWTTHRAALLSGRPIRDRQHGLAPVTDGTDVIGLLYLWRPETFHVERFGAFRVGLVKVLRAFMAGADPGSVEGMRGSMLSLRPSEIRREQLLMALDEEGWCISRAARLLGITRRAVYLRMKRYGVPLRPRPGESGA